MAKKLRKWKKGYVDWKTYKKMQKKYEENPDDPEVKAHAEKTDREQGWIDPNKERKKRK